MILVGIPCLDTIKARTAFALYNLARTDISPELVMEIGADLAHNRNKLVMKAIEGKYSHLLFIDSDMVFNSNLISLMLARDVDILGVAVNHRSLPLTNNIKPLDGNIKGAVPGMIFEAESCGTGIMLIKTEALKEIDAPWFEFSYDEGERIGEDVNFCRKARKTGFKIWVDPTIPVRHLGEYAY